MGLTLFKRGLSTILLSDHFQCNGIGLDEPIIKNAFSFVFSVSIDNTILNAKIIPALI
jgi:hypothetical protein